MKLTKTIASLALAFGTAATALAQGTALAPGTSFTYQGCLLDNSGPGNGVYDLVFTEYQTDCTNDSCLYTPPSYIAIASTTNTGVSVVNGLFTTAVDLGQLRGTNIWLQIGVRSNGTTQAFSMLTGWQPITATPFASYATQAGSVPGLKVQNFIDPTNYPPNLVGGSIFNYAVGPGTTGQLSGIVIAGGGASGFPNSVAANYGVVGGGASNTVTAAYGAVVGGLGNTASGDHSVVVAGEGNYAMGTHSFVGSGLGNEAANTGDVVVGGYGNTAAGDPSFIGAGMGNTVGGVAFIGLNGMATNSFIGAGFTNRIYADNSGIVGGMFNAIFSNSTCAFIGGGFSNNIQTNATYSSIVGGFGNQIQSLPASPSAGNLIGGGDDNIISVSCAANFIGAGSYNQVLSNSAGCFIGSGYNNQIQTNGLFDVVGGGIFNQIQFGSQADVLSGGSYNQIQILSLNDVIGGGLRNQIQTNGQNDVIGGGAYNQIQTGGQNDVIGGGYANLIGSNVSLSVISGGTNNLIEGTNAAGLLGNVIGGGQNNTISNVNFAVISGGAGNWANQYFGTIPGGWQANATNYAQFAYASGNFKVAGDAQYSMYVLRNITTNYAGQQNLYLGGSLWEVALPTNRACTFHLMVTGIDQAHNSYGYSLEGNANGWNGNVVTTGTGTAYPNGLNPGASTPGVSVSGGFLHVYVVGINGEIIRWTATLQTSEIAWW